MRWVSQIMFLLAPAFLFSSISEATKKQESRIMSTMNTLICQEPKKLVWKERDIPIPGNGEALIKIK